jgi:cystathionine beta-lyase
MWNFDEPVKREGTHSIKYDLREEIFGVKNIIPMWIADMDIPTPGFIAEKIRERAEHKLYGYSFRSGNYYNSIIGWMQRRHNWHIEKDWICFCPGIVPALNISTLSFTRPGDTVIVQPPVYTPFFGAVEDHGRTLAYNQLTNDTGKWLMDLDLLKRTVKDNVKMIIISNPHNPAGRAWTREELAALAGICLENEILILSDEIHCDLVLPGFKHTPVASLSEEVADITVTCIAPSKTFNLAGLATSSVIISNPVLRKYFTKKTGSLHIGNGNIFGNIASEAAYSMGDEWVDELMKYIQGNVEYVKGYCRNYIPEIIPSETEATYMIWLDCRKLGMKGDVLQEFFVKKAGLGLNEGSTFGPGGEGFMRMNVACPRQTVVRAMEQTEVAVSDIR